jgi:hypothetical protein
MEKSRMYWGKANVNFWQIAARITSEILRSAQDDSVLEVIDDGVA